jgi:hypothetical protein
LEKIIWIAVKSKRVLWSNGIIENALICPECGWSGYTLSDDDLLQYFEGDLRLLLVHLRDWVIASVKHRMLHLFPRINGKCRSKYLKEAQKIRNHIIRKRPPLSAMAYDPKSWKQGAPCEAWSKARRRVIVPSEAETLVDYLIRRKAILLSESERVLDYLARGGLRPHTWKATVEDKSAAPGLDASAGTKTARP